MRRWSGSVKRGLMLLLAAACLIGAAVAVIGAGLPERAAYTGLNLPGELPVAPEVNAIAPPFETVGLTGETVRLLDLRGTPVVLNFWATWCAPCVYEMPELQAFHEAHPEARLIALNLGERPDAIAAWVREYRLTFDVALDPTGEIAARYWLRGQPSTYVISPGGVITHIFYGATTRAALEEALQPYLDQSSVTG
jgi:peroxiredoxin